MCSVGTSRGQALVEFALVAPLLMLMLLGVLAGGLYFLAAVQQASDTGTLADWYAANPDAPPGEWTAFADAVCPCEGCATVAAEAHIVMVTVECPCIAGELLPFLPRTVVTTATAYVPSPSASPEPSPSASPEPSEAPSEEP
jgi:hypothetical protein